MKVFYKLLIAVTLIGYMSTVQAQVSGLSYTISPAVEYNWFGDESGLADGYLAGAQLGIGFGEYVELRALYLQGYELENDITNFGLDLADGVDTSYMSRGVDLKRYGGELMLNLSRGALLPYVTVGTGIQEIGLEDDEASKQIYVTGGGGIKFSLANRLTLGFQGLHTLYRSNPLSTLLTADDRAMLDISDTRIMDVSSWALRGTLAIYLGGRKPGQLSAVDKAYFDNFSGGFRGLSIPIEPSYSQIDFDDNLNFRDTRLGGLSAGLNLGPLVGIRAFYWKALQEDSFTEFDDLVMYGGEARFSLNEGKGLTPWISIGAGQIDVEDGYVGRDSSIVNSDKAFAMGGLGLDLPFSKYVKASGFVRSVLTSANTVEDVVSSEDIVNSLNYGVSLNFVLGRKAGDTDDAIKAREDKIYTDAQTEFEAASAELRAEYDERISSLENELEAAIINEDIEAIKEITEEKELVEQVQSTIPEVIVEEEKSDKKDKKDKEDKSSKKIKMTDDPNESIIRMTPAEFQLLLRDLMSQNIAAPVEAPIAVPTPAPANEDRSSLDDKINEYRTEDKFNRTEDKFNAIDKEFDNVFESIAELKDDQKDTSKEMTNQLDDLDDELSELKAKIESLVDAQNSLSQSLASQDGNVTIQTVESEATTKRITQLQKQMKKMEATLEGRMKDVDTEKSDTGMVSNRNFVNVSDDLDNRGDGFFSKFTYEGMSGFAGLNLGGNSTANLGYRLHYAVGDADSTKVTFMPETYFGFGSPSAFGIMANVTYDLPFLTKSEIITPYIGTGLGFMKVGEDGNDDKLKGAFNLIFGTYLNVWKGDMYIDLTARNIFRYNQVVVGYRFPF